MTYQEFKNKWLGKAIDFDGAYGAQCFDVYRQYCKELGLGQSPKVVGAKDIWTTYLTKDFDKVENTPTGIPPQGAVLIWGTVVGQYGHVAICDRATAKSFVSIDQNWPVDNGTGVLHEVTHNYNGLLGWLIPKSIINDMTEEQKKIFQIIDENKLTEGDIRWLSDLKKNQTVPNLEIKITDLETKIDGLKTTISDQYKELDEINLKHGKLLEEYNILLPKYEELLKDKPNQQSIETTAKFNLIDFIKSLLKIK